jgi:hypothetical protein
LKIIAFLSVFLLLAPLVFAEDEEPATEATDDSEAPETKVVGVDIDLEFMFYYPTDINNLLADDMSGYMTLLGMSDMILCLCPAVKVNFFPLSFLAVSIEVRGYLAPKIVSGGPESFYLHSGVSGSVGPMLLIDLGRNWTLRFALYGGYYLADFTDFDRYNYIGSNFGASAEASIQWRSFYIALDGRYAPVSSSPSGFGLEFIGGGIRIGTSF